MNLDTIATEFKRGFSAGEELGASVSVWKEGEEVLSLHEGFTTLSRTPPWTKDTIIPTFSATKGPAAATLILALDHAGMNLESEVRRLWSTFPISGATFGDILSHRCGLCGIEKEVMAQDYHAVLRAIEEQPPLWEPMTAHGYHPRLAGYMADECVRRLTGMTLGAFWQEQIATPLGIDFWIGLPEDLDHRVATLYPGKMSATQMKDDPFYSQIGKSGTIPNTAFKSPKGVQGASEMNKAENWRPGYPAMGGLGTASGLAKFYQATLGNIPATPFTPLLRTQFNTRLSNGQDLTLCAPTSFGGGFMMDPLNEKGEKIRSLIGSDAKGYGHPGAGGSHAFADPTTGYSFAYVMNQMEVSVLPGERVKRMLGQGTPV